MTLETLKIEFQAEASGLEGQLSGLAASLDGLGGKLDAVAATALTAGRSVADSFVSGARSGVGAAQSAGGALAAGFAQGVTARTGAVLAAVQRMVSRATALMRTALSIHSPSKVTAAFGARFGEGFAQGILGTSGMVNAAASALAGGGAAALSAPLSAELPRETLEAQPIGAAAARQAVENLSLTIPLNVDGMKLGEASIRGINAVTRSAGRVLLNL